jgi:hypothetical protein
MAVHRKYVERGILVIPRNHRGWSKLWSTGTADCPQGLRRHLSDRLLMAHFYTVIRHPARG